MSKRQNMKLCLNILTTPSRLYLVVIIINNISSLSIVDKGILPIIKNSIAVQLYIDIENKNRLNPCRVHASQQKCCLAGQDKYDCSLLEIYAPRDVVIKPRDRRTLLYTSPLIHQHDQGGHCEFEILYQCNEKVNVLHALVPLDTRVIKYTKKLLGDYLRNEKPSSCDTLDQDSLDDCSPVYCDLKYLGHRMFYDNIKNTCIEIPVCIGDLDKELPDVVYVPASNTCRNLDMPVTIDDIYAITSGLGVATQPATQPNDYLEVKSNCSTISQNINLLRDLMCGRLCPCTKDKVTDFGSCCKSAIVSIALCIISITAILFSFICCVRTLLWLYVKGSEGEIKAHWWSFKNRFKGKQRQDTSKINANLKNALLKDVIVKDIPIELRDSVANLCDRMGKEVGKRRRYRDEDIGSQISLIESRSPIHSESDE